MSSATEFAFGGSSGGGGASKEELTTHANVYRNVFLGSGRADTSAASGTKYLLNPGATNQSNISNGTTALMLCRYKPADHAITGLTTKLRLSVVVFNSTAPAVTVVCGFYPLTGTTQLAAGTVVAGSTCEVASPAANTASALTSGDFTPPEEGNYAIGYTVSGTPGGAMTLQATLQVRNV